MRTEFLFHTQVGPIVAVGSGYGHGTVEETDPEWVAVAHSCLAGYHRPLLGGDDHSSSTYGSTCTTWSNAYFH